MVGDLSDSQLLQRFLSGRDGTDEAAFSALMERHGPMVLSVCRQVLGNPHDAQDAFQATFLVMARKAGSVHNADSLASWLHGSAPRVAARAKADEARRRRHERRFAMMKVNERDKATVGPDPCPELHEEIARLPRRYREPVVLCYLEGLSSEQAAMRIGCARGPCGPGCLGPASGCARAWSAARGLPGVMLVPRVHNACIDRSARNFGRGDGHDIAGLRRTTRDRGRIGLDTGDHARERRASCHDDLQAENLGAAALACFLALEGVRTLNMARLSAGRFARQEQCAGRSRAQARRQRYQFESPCKYDRDGRRRAGTAYCQDAERAQEIRAEIKGPSSDTPPVISGSRRAVRERTRCTIRQGGC